MQHFSRLLKVLSVIGLFGLWAPDLARAQTCFMDSVTSGDSTFACDNCDPSVLDLVNSSTLRSTYYLTPWGVDASSFLRDAFGASCSGYTNIDCGGRRLLNAAVLINAVDIVGTSYTWNDFVYPRVNSTEYTSACTFGALDTWSNMDLGKQAIFGTHVLERASTIVHEARHDDEKPHCGNGPSCACYATTTSCDPTFAYDGSVRKEIEFLDQVLDATDSLDLPPAVRDLAIETVNGLINNWFGAHPGFNLVHRFGSPFQVDSSPWTTASGPIEAFARPRKDGVSLPLFYVEVDPGTDSFVRHLGACSRQVGFGPGTNLVTDWAQVCDVRSAANPTNLASVTLGADSNGNPIVATGFKIRGGANGTVAGMQLIGRSLIDDSTTGQTDVVASFGTSGTWDVQVAAQGGYYLTALGLSKSGNAMNQSASTHTLGPSYESPAGGSGGIAHKLKCNAGQFPVGIVGKPTMNGLYVGYFGIVCADGSNLVSNRRVVRGTYHDEATGIDWPAGNFPYGGANEPPGKINALCPSGYLLRGLDVRAGIVVDNVTAIRCSNNLVYSVSGMGGGGGTLRQSDCFNFPAPAVTGTTNASYVPYVHVGTGWALDQVAIGCTGPANYQVGFEGELNHDSDGFDLLNVGGDNFDWSFYNPGDLTILFTGPSAPYAGIRYAYIAPGGVNANSQAFLVSREIDMRYLRHTALKLEWKDHLFGSTMGELQVQIRARGGAWTTLATRSGNLGDQWNSPAPLDLSTYIGTVFQIRFIGKRGAGVYSELAIDNVRLWSE